MVRIGWCKLDAGFDADWNVELRGDDGVPVVSIFETRAGGHGSEVTGPKEAVVEVESEGDDIGRGTYESEYDRGESNGSGCGWWDTASASVELPPVEGEDDDSSDFGSGTGDGTGTRSDTSDPGTSSDADSSSGGIMRTVSILNSRENRFRFLFAT